MKRHKMKRRRISTAVLCGMTLTCSVWLAGCAGKGTNTQTQMPSAASVEQTADSAAATNQNATANQTTNSAAATDQAVDDAATMNQTTDGAATAEQTTGHATEQAATAEQTTDNAAAANQAVHDAATTNQAANDAAAGSQNSPTQSVSGDVSLAQAKRAVLAYVQTTDGLTADDVTFIKEETDYEDGIATYEIEFVSDTHKYEFEVRADNGSIIKTSAELIEQLQGTVAAVLTPEEAKRIALDAAKLTADQATFAKVELDYDPGDNTTEYEIEFYADNTEYELTIDAVTGKVLEMETERR